MTASHSINAAVSKSDSETISIDAAIGVYTIYYVNKDPEDVAYYARYITTFQDLDSNNYKHIKYAHAVGDYGNNEVTLYWTKFPDYSNWNTLAMQTSTTTYGDLIVWRNLCHARRIAFALDWAGTDNIAHDAIEVHYNIKSQ